jgi:pyruvate,water dikinase
MASLAEILRLGLEVPPAFVVSSRAFSDFMKHHGIDASLLRFLRRGGASEEGSLAHEARAMRDAIRNGELMPELAAEIVGAYRQLQEGSQATPRIVAQGGGGPCAVSVRSSAILEDQAAQSCAGMYDTFLMITDENLLCDMVKMCWASLFSDRSIWYLKTKGRGEDDAALWRMAVGVQRMVNARSAGVAMTVHPSTGDPSSIYVEATWGLGESLVQGLVDPDCFKVDKVTLEWVAQSIGTKREQLVCNYDAGSVEQIEVDEPQRTALCLSEHDLIKIAKAATIIERHYGQPEDVEWAISGEGESAVLHLLQARPQTALPEQEPRAMAKERTAVEYVLRMLG